ncbi:MAG: hypothetical protein ACOH2V_14695 [Candidatus Saccharimonadaceae bacterium]
MNKNLEEVVSTISNWNALKRDKKKVLDLVSKYSSFKIRVPENSKCDKKFHIYFGVRKNAMHPNYAMVMHVISDFNDQGEVLKKIEATDPYIFSVDFDLNLGNPYEIDEQEATMRKVAWQDSKVLERWLLSNDVFEMFVIDKDNFLPDHNYTAHFGMKRDPDNEGSYIPDIIIQNDSMNYKTFFYDLARLCPPYGRKESFGLQELSC